jgi:hypothetical protein
MECRKTQYNIKNVYLTLNKIPNTNTTNRIEREPKPMKKKEKEKPQYYNQYKASKIVQRSTKFHET